MKLTEIIEGIFAVNTALWIKEKRILVIGDVHMGYEEAAGRKGFLVPNVQFGMSEEVLKDIFEAVEPETIVINGDLKHEFGEISDQEWMDTSKFIDKLGENCKKIVLVKGNHDTFLGPIAKKKGLEIVDFYRFELNKEKELRGESRISKVFKALTNNKKIKSICIFHGDKLRKEKEVVSSDLLIIGHEHPAVVLSDGAKKEKFKCFLLGKWKKQRIITMPSFLPTIEGTDIKREGLLSPYLNQILDNFEVFAVGDKVYRFGKLKEIL